MNRRRFLLGSLGLALPAISIAANLRAWAGMDFATKGVTAWWVAPGQSVPISEIATESIPLVPGFGFSDLYGPYNWVCWLEIEDGVVMCGAYVHGPIKTWDAFPLTQWLDGDTDPRKMELLRHNVRAGWLKIDSKFQRNWGWLESVRAKPYYP
jgi:hypothetical protein